MVGVLNQALWEPVFTLSGGGRDCLTQFTRFAGGCDLISHLAVVSFFCLHCVITFILYFLLNHCTKIKILNVIHRLVAACKFSSHTFGGLSITDFKAFLA